jgi:two-component system nitrate/nitrite sensor histidine kinase NarX
VLLGSTLAQAAGVGAVWPLALVNGVTLAAAAVLGGVLYRRIHHQLLRPLAQMRGWAQELRAGRLDARVAVPAGGDFADLARDVNRLSDELQRLSERMDNEICRQTESLAQKTRSLQVLYDVAASINIFNNLDDLLAGFLHTLTEVVRARGATVRLLDSDEGRMRLVASVGLSDEELGPLERLAADPADPSRWGTVVADGEDRAEPQHPQAAEGLTFSDGAAMQILSVPLRYHGNTLGAYNLFLDRVPSIDREDLWDVLTSVGRHLGMAIEKVRVDRQAQRLSIMQERNLLAHELHDSLAQTLASLRFQVRMMEDTLAHEGVEAARGEVAKIRSSLDEANGELRGLLAHFRSPMDSRGLVPSIEDLVGRFRRETGIVTFFQKECEHSGLPASLEMQVLRILQEALANIRKHSRAHVVRILFHCERDGGYRLLVEDDGVGMAADFLENRPGEHLGLEIMRERARRLGGTISLDSEPAEGTRVELAFTYQG